MDAVKTAVEASTDQLSQYLTGIQDAIENQGTGGTGGPVSDSGTHDRLDAIKTAVDNAKAATDSVASAVNETKTELADSLQNLQASNEASATEAQNRLNDIKTAVSETKSAVDAVKTATDSVTTAVNGVGDKIDGIGTKLDGIGEALNGDPDAVAGAGQGALDGLNDQLDEMDADDHWTKVFNDLIDEANNAVNDTDFGGYSSPGDFLEKSGLTKPSEITKMADLSGAACEPLEFNIHGKTYTYNLCTTITEIRNILYWLFAISTAFFVYVHFMRILTRERLT